MIYKDKDSYMGGKNRSGTYQTIINQIPPHRHYIEGFAGMAGVFRNMKTDASCLLIEMDKDLFSTYESAGFKKLSGFVDHFQAPSKERMCVNGNAINLLRAYRHTINFSNTFIYLDPPYPLSSRKSRTKYKYELTDSDHLILLQTIISYTNSNIAISTYPNEMYTKVLGKAGWRVIEFQSRTRGRTATEQLWMNYPEPKYLHDYQYIGEDYRERERIARMQNRWKAKFKELPDLERNAMLQQLQTLQHSL